MDNTQKSDLSQYTVHVIDNNHFSFYIEHVPSGRKSYHASYTQIAMLDDVAAITGYYAGSSEKELVPLTAADALREFAVCESKPQDYLREGYVIGTM